MLDHVNPEHHLRSMIGYHCAFENSLVGMVMVQGKQREVINIGLGIKQLVVEPRDATVAAYAESLSHKVRLLFFASVQTYPGHQGGRYGSIFMITPLAAHPTRTLFHHPRSRG